MEKGAITARCYLASENWGERCSKWNNITERSADDFRASAIPL